MKGEYYKKAISSVRWLRLRKSQLTNYPLCARCEGLGRVTAACEVHHVTPVESVNDPTRQRSLMFDESNIMSVCHDCHVEIHKSLGKNTKSERQQRVNQEVEDFEKKYFG